MYSCLRYTFAYIWSFMLPRKTDGIILHFSLIIINTLRTHSMSTHLYKWIQTGPNHLASHWLWGETPWMCPGGSSRTAGSWDFPAAGLALWWVPRFGGMGFPHFGSEGSWQQRAEDLSINQTPVISSHPGRSCSLIYPCMFVLVKFDWYTIST